MTNLEIILMIIIVIFLFAFIVYKNHIDVNHLNIQSKASVEVNKLQKLVDDGIFDSILNVNKFNNWFNSPKDESIYAHPGIFLRLDKLSTHHIHEYISTITNGYLKYEDFGQNKMYSFENKIRKNWVKKLSKHENI